MGEKAQSVAGLSSLRQLAEDRGKQFRLYKPRTILSLPLLQYHLKDCSFHDKEQLNKLSSEIWGWSQMNTYRS